MVTEEELKNMSPEEIKELQKKNCIFCHIISGKVQSKKIYEDEICLAILDINPANPGHVLIMPKEHVSIMPLLKPETISHLFKIAKRISQISLKALKTSGTNIFVANGLVAGQKAQHFMIHVIPRKENDGLKNFSKEGIKINEQEFENMHTQLEKVITSSMQGKPLPNKDNNNKKNTNTNHDNNNNVNADLDDISKIL